MLQQNPPAAPDRPTLTGAFASWLRALAWHLMRIATLRPAYACLSDAGGVASSFVLAYLACGALRWGLVSEAGMGVILMRLLMQLGIVLAFFERRHRSSTLVAALLGASAAADLIALALFLLLGWPGGVWSVILELAMLAGCIIAFFRLPKDMQARGYRFSSR